MKIYMVAIGWSHLYKKIIPWFVWIYVIPFWMRENLPGVGAGQALRGKVDVCTLYSVQAVGGHWIDKKYNY